MSNTLLGQDTEKELAAGKIRPEDTINPSEDYMSTVAEIYDKYYKWRLINTNSWPQLKGMRLLDYVKQSRNKMYGYSPVSSEYELTGRKVFLTNEFRNQAEMVLTFIANLAQNPKFTGSQGLDFQVATLLSGLYKFVTKGTDYKLKTLLHYWHVVMDGTVIVYVGYSPHKHTVRNIKEIDMTTGHVRFEEHETLDEEISEEIVDITDFYFPKIYETDIQKQGEVIWRNVMSWSDFKQSFKGYPHAEKVVPGNMLVTDSIFSRLLDKTVLISDKIEVIKYFDKVKDRYVLVANGIWINPVGEEDDEISPLPWNHKQLPFAKTIYRFIDGNFFWGASLPQLVNSAVEAKENLMEMTIDRLFKSINPPILTRDPRVQNGFKLESGNVYHVNSDPNTDWRELQMGSVDPNMWTLGQNLDSVISKTATPMTAPSNNTRQPKSAAENMIQNQQQQQAFNFQKLFYQDLLEQKAYLSVDNVLQFYTVGDMHKMVGDKAYQNIFHVNDISTSSGQSNLEVRFVQKNSQLSKVEELMNQKLLKAVQSKEKVDIIEISYEMIKDLKYEIEIDFDFEETPELRKAMFTDFMGFLMQNFPDQIDKTKLLFRAMEVWNENPGDYLPDNIVKGYAQYVAGQYQTPPPNPMQSMGPPQGPVPTPGGQPTQPMGGGPTGQAVQQSQIHGPASGRGKVKPVANGKGGMLNKMMGK